MRWAWLDGRVGFLALLLALAVAFWALLAPAATAARAPDALLGLAQLLWWALCHLIALTFVLLLLRPPGA
jgi:hypothetical protein